MLGKERLKPVALPPGDFQKVLDALDLAAQSARPAQDGRRARRHPYRSPEVIVRILSSRATDVPAYCVPSRNISAGGLAFLYRQALAAGQKLEIHIPLLDEQSLCVLARVVRCRHVKGMVHEIGVEFVDVRR